jgi:hypothetical protein
MVVNVLIVVLAVIGAGTAYGSSRTLGPDFREDDE